MSIFDAFRISGSGMTAERLRLDLISNNIANMNTAGKPGDPNLQPYKRQMPVFSEVLDQTTANGNGIDAQGGGVMVSKIIQDNSPPKLEYDPSNPDADSAGYVAYPNINVVNEMVDSITATRAYEANVTTLNAAKDMASKALQIGN